MLQGNLLSGVSEGSEYRTGDGIPYGQYAGTDRSNQPQNMYRISDDGNKMECMVELEDGTVLDLPEDKWTAVIKSGLDACGFSGGQNVRNITLKEA